MDCDFISSAYFSDVLKVVSKIKEIKKASFIMTQEIKKDERLIFKTEVTLVLAKDGKPKRIDENIKDMLQSLFAKIE